MEPCHVCSKKEPSAAATVSPGLVRRDLGASVLTSNREPCALSECLDCRRQNVPRLRTVTESPRSGPQLHADGLRESEAGTRGCRGVKQGIPLEKHMIGGDAEA